jgi:hypothetical protein
VGDEAEMNEPLTQTKEVSREEVVSSFANDWVHHHRSDKFMNSYDCHSVVIHHEGRCICS